MRWHGTIARNVSRSLAIGLGCVVFAGAASCGSLPRVAHWPVTMSTTTMTATSTDRNSASQPARRDLKLEVRVAQRTINRGDPVDIIVSLTNLSEKPVRLPDLSAYQNYRYDVRTESGNPVRLTEFGQRLYADFLRVSFIDLEPWDTIETTVRISQIFDMSLGGTFVIKVSRNWPNRDRAGQPVTSDPVVIKLTS